MKWILIRNQLAGALPLRNACYEIALCRTVTAGVHDA